MPSLSFLFGFVLFVWLCHRAQIGLPDPTVALPARWEAKLRIHDVEKDKSQSANVDVVVDARKFLRMEVSYVLGVALASFVMDDRHFQCASYRQKTFYDGALTENALKPLIHFALSPIVLRNVVLDEPMTGSDWRCKPGEDGKISECRSPGRSMVVSWNRGPNSKTARVDSPKFQLDWIFHEPPTEVQIQDNTFRLDPPAGFRVIHLEK